jgi:hypothetical protein
MSFFFTKLNLGYFFEIFQGVPMLNKHQKIQEGFSAYKALTVKSVNFNTAEVIYENLVDYYIYKPFQNKKYFLKPGDYIINSKGKRQGVLIPEKSFNDTVLISQHFIALRIKPELQDKAAFFYTLLDLLIADIPYATSKTQSMVFTRIKDVENYQIDFGNGIEQEYDFFQKEYSKYQQAKNTFREKEIRFQTYLNKIKQMIIVSNDHSNL